MNMPYKLYNQDCAEVIPTLEGIGAVVTDPPYGIEYSSNKEGKFKGVKIEGDKNFDVANSILEIFKELPMAIYANPTMQPPKWLELQHVLIWDKSPLPGMGDLNSAWRRDIEFIWIHKKNGWQQVDGRLPSVLRGETIVTWSSVEFGRLHPTQKSVSVTMKVIERLKADVIFDPFMGSGTTGVACMKLGREFIGCEIDPKYFAIAEKRISQAALQPGLFTPSNNHMQRTANAASQQSSLFAAGEQPAKVSGAKRRR